ncbi:MAG: SDR family oxidoreductase [Hahellaceae bacterium]|nr:SDR family oxidoreductase [Hahellaceae bacterium]MCP5169368.1 SDR family oxidoreductase [Hahellaceae bacterium]
MSNLVVVTGANKGIGLEFCRYYVQQGMQVVAVCRQPSEELNALGCEIISDVDVANEADVARLAARLEGRKIHLLINNAGIFTHQLLPQPDFAAIEQQFAVNAMGPLRVTTALLPCLTEGSKIGLITSRMGSIRDNTSGGYYGYRMSKAALNAAGKSLAIDLRSRQIAVAILHPGFVKTSMVGYAGDISPQTAAQRLAQRLDDLTLETSGTFWHSSGEILPW